MGCQRCCPGDCDFDFNRLRSGPFERPATGPPRLFRGRINTATSLSTLFHFLWVLLTGS